MYSRSGIGLSGHYGSLQIAAYGKSVFRDVDDSLLDSELLDDVDELLDELELDELLTDSDDVELIDELELTDEELVELLDDELLLDWLDVDDADCEEELETDELLELREDTDELLISDAWTCFGIVRHLYAMLGSVTRS